MNQDQDLTGLREIVNNPVPLGDVDTRADIVKKWLQSVLFNDAHVWVGTDRSGVTITVMGFGGAQAPLYRLHLSPDTPDVSVFPSVGRMDALTAMAYVAERIRK